MKLGSDPGPELCGHDDVKIITFLFLLSPSHVEMILSILFVCVAGGGGGCHTAP